MPPTPEQRRTRALMGRYGITDDTYAALLMIQDGRCGICRKPPKPGIRLDVDHDHRHMRIRGLLCRYCNTRVIGRHRDASLFEAAAAYLRKPPANQILSEHQVPRKNSRRTPPKRT